MKYSRIIGTGAYYPEKVMTNADFEKMVETTDEWITTRTGIKTRHITAKDETTSDMAYKAALNAIDMAGIKASEIDGIIFATLSGDYTLPNTATMLQHKLGISGSFAFDLNVACSGFVYSLSVADAMIKVGQCKTILIACAERLSAMTDFTDRNTCVLFGDAAGCAIVRASDTPGVRSTNISADGTFGDLLTMHGVGTTYLANRDTMRLEDNFIKMNGREVFKQAVRMMEEAAVKAVADSGLQESDITFLVPHQANMRIIEATAKRFNLSMDKVLINLDRCGNTSSATIPTVLDDGIRSGKVKTGDNLVIVAFGGGATWGGSVVTL
ncbi:MAG: ketoacyl-ACP synthase III [Deferribacteraceae bacterium]|jgi:3-oxoacyl-[acyl-carrier-protein] synthase-3|nr:ketoacyl-ACP synthase III [Deferribacteraceae bacterium]